jgi:hypothetical protein
MASLKRAIENHCKDCIYDETESGSWRSQVKTCNLCEVMPVTISTREANRTKRINTTEID